MKPILTTLMGASLLIFAAIPARHASAVATTAAAEQVMAELPTAGPDTRPEARQPKKLSPRRLPQALLDGQFDAIYAQFGTDLQAQVTKEAFRKQLQTFSSGVTAYSLQSILRTVDSNQYIWTNVSGTKGLMAAFDRTQAIIGFYAQGLLPHPETDRVYTKNEFIMPVTGRWFTFWGGTNELLNYHYPYESQRYAYDLIVVKKKMSFGGDHLKNESYFAFGQDVIAPAAGKIVAIQSEIADNIPVGQTTNVDQPFGNYIVIDHGQNEYSVIGHLKRGSVRVQPGQPVMEGEPIALTGNSGNSSEPHVHFQVQDHPEPGQGRSIRIRLKNGHEPVRGEFIRS